MNVLNYLVFLTATLFASVVLAATQPQKPAPAEPDFFGANGAQITVDGKQYTIKIGAAAGNGKRDVTVTSAANGQKSYQSNPNQANHPVNHHKDGIQVFVGTDQRDVMVPAGQAHWNGLSVVMIGLGGDDILVGSTTVSGDVILGGDGNDLIIGREGTDQLWGGAGDDAIAGGPGSDTIVGGPGNDASAFEALFVGSGVKDNSDGSYTVGDKAKQHQVILLVAPEEDVPLKDEFNSNAFGLWGQGEDDDIWGETGDDVIVGGVRTHTDANYLDGGDGEDIVRGGQGQDSIYGGDLDDTLLGGIGTSDAGDFIFGGSGLDSISGAGGADELFGESDNDTIYAFVKGTDRDDGGNRIEGNTGDDNLFGASGPDTILGHAGSDKIMGAPGNDTISGGDDVGDEIDGGTGDDAIWAGEGIDTVRGGLGDDFIDGEDGNDRLFGDDGEDRLVDVDTLFNILHGGVGNDEINCFDNNILGSWDDAFGGPGLDTFWADEFSLDFSSMGDDLLDLELAETWHVMAGPTGSLDGRVKP